MDLNQLAVFVRVVDSGSFTKAAKALLQPKSRVSRRIAALEKELGTSLLYRTTRQFSLTEAGRELYQRVRNEVYSLAQAKDFLQGSANEVSGTLNVTASHDVGTHLLGSLIAELHEQYPKLSVQLHLSNTPVDLVKEGIDLALRIGALKDGTLKARPLGKIALILVASPEYLKKSSKIEKLKDLAEHPALAFTVETTGNTWVLRTKSGKDEKVSVQILCRSNNPRVLLDLALAGKGVALVPEFLCVDAIKEGKLVRVLRDYFTRPATIQFVWPSQTEANPKVRAFIEIGLKRLQGYF